MTTLDDVTKTKAEESAEQKAAVELVRLVQEQGLSLTGPEGLLKQLTKSVFETALDEEMTEHFGYEKHDPPDAGTGNIRNGTQDGADRHHRRGGGRRTAGSGGNLPSRGSSRSVDADCPVSMRWCCRCARKA